MGLSLVAQPEIDADVLEGCRRGEPDAQRVVFERYRDRVYSIALRYLRGDEAGAKDVTQEVFVKAYRAMRTFRADARLSTWLYRIVANACTDELRRRRRLVLLGDVPERQQPAVRQPEPAAPDVRIGAAIDRLTPKLRLVVLLRYYEDLSYEEIAEAIGSTKGTVASRLNRAHAFLAQELAPVRHEGGRDA